MSGKPEGIVICMVPVIFHIEEGEVVDAMVAAKPGEMYVELAESLGKLPKSKVARRELEEELTAVVDRGEWPKQFGRL
jgi:hypothetical protein